ncbi:MAG: S41 family peptidase, partial [Gemmatimonadota bacterium]|nr:S41 family peptidase [Gemmatimonadota bacterium]
EPPAVASDSTGIARLAHAAALWNAVRLYHPAAAGHLAWENASVRHLTDVRAARSREEYASAIREWLATLHDRDTRLLSAADVAPPVRSVVTGVPIFSVVATSSTPVRKSVAVTTDTVTIVAWPAAVAANDSAAWTELQNRSAEVGNRAHVIIDLRGQGAATKATNNAHATFVKNAQIAFASKFAGTPAAGPSVRRRAYDGWPNEQTGASQFGNALWRVGDPLAIVPANATPIANRHVVILADSTSEIPPALLALISTRQATLVAENGMDPRAYTPSATVSLGEGLSARVRTGELLNSDGSIGIQADTVVITSSVRDDSMAAKTAQLIARGVLNVAAERMLPNDNDALYANSAWNFSHYPIMGARLLGAFKLWGTVRDFHAYRELNDENIDAALVRIIPRVEASKDADSYAGAMLDFASVLDDAQATLSSPAITQHLGAAWAPFRARWIEGRAIVTSVASNADGRTSGLAVGDEITAADGYPMPAYVAEHRRYGAASNDWTRMRNIMEILPRGNPGEASYRARDANSRDRQLTITRTIENAAKLPATERYGTAVWRELAGEIGYIDLDRATPAGIDSAFKSFAQTKAIVLDARAPTVRSDQLSAALTGIVQRVSQQPAVVIDRQAIRISTAPCSPAEPPQLASCLQERRQFDNVMYADTSHRYRGRIVLLIDERTQGALEQFGLALESVSNALFIGTPSAGASGSVTAVKLPGLMTLSFSGSEIRHADGRQLQRVGLTPQVDVHPTVKGVRAGTDEVLERALQYLQQQIDPPARRKK